VRRTTYRADRSHPADGLHPTGELTPLVYYQFTHLLRHPDLAHGVFTRLGGYSQPPWDSLNTGHTVGDDLEAVRANHELIFEALGVHREDVVSPRQVHGTSVRVVDGRDKGQVCPETDALVTVTPGVVLMLRFADCVPVLLFDPIQGVVGLAHAGWRGTVAGMARSAVQAMVNDLGCLPADILAGVGPSIGPCCYEVGREVVDATRRAFADVDGLLMPRANGRWHLDLWAANRRQLADAGVQHIEVAGICTACHTDEWFSHRAERGKTGRMGALIGLRKGIQGG
jgi:YfiH family protein